MKILIKDDSDFGFRAVPIKIKIAGGDSYNIDVQVQHEAVDEPEVEVVETPVVTSTEPADDAEPDSTEATTEPAETETVLDITDPLPPAAKSGATKTIEIKITLPALPKQLPSRQQIIQMLRTTSRRRIIVASAIVAALVVLIVGTQFVGNKPSSSVASDKRPELQRGTPTYPTVLPSGKSISSLGGWVRISPPDRAPVYTYVDQIGSTQINVSEQPLPAGFKDDPQKIANLAQNFNATQKVTAGSTIVYIGTSEKGPQSVIFQKNNLLVLIKSADTLSGNDWVTYVSSLQ